MRILKIKVSKQIENKLTYIDLVAGSGGLSLGRHNAGWEGIFAVEKNADAFKTLKHDLIDNKNHFNWSSGLLRKQDVPRYLQIGNSIPPVFAERNGLVLKKLIS